MLLVLKLFHFICYAIDLIYTKKKELFFKAKKTNKKTFLANLYGWTLPVFFLGLNP